MRGTFWSRLVRPLTLLLIVALLPVVPAAPAPAAFASGNSCLTLTGTLKENNGTVYMFHPITFEYTIRPEGELIELVRDPVDVAMVLDVSGSMNYGMLPNKTKPTRLDTLKEASLSFLNDLADQRAGDRVGLVKFATTASVVRSLTNNYNTLKQDIERLSASGNTNIDDGLRKGREVLNAGSNQQKFIILVSDGYPTHYGNGKSGGSEAKRQALLRADELAAAGIPVYSIALGTPGSSDVDHALLEQIAAKTGGQKFSAGNVNELKEVFRNITKAIQKQGKISNIYIRQPVPDGFELGEDNPPGTRIEDGVLIVPIPDITYPFTVNEFKVTITLKQTKQVGNYTFEDATLTFRDACDRDSSTIIPNNNSITVAGWVDTWGNLYVGDENGAVIRYRHGDLSQKQFTIPGNGKLVTNISFEGSAPGVDDDAIVRVTYADGSTLTLNLLPKAPTITLTDKNNKAIENDDGWFAGPAKVSVSGSGHQLPENTVFEGANDDFQGGYLAGYEYRIVRYQDGDWQPVTGWKSANEPFLLEEIGEDIRVEARAFTTSVSGDENYKSYSSPASQTTSLDNSGPVITFVADYEGNPTNTDPLLKITVTDKESPLKRVLVEVDGHKKTIEGNGKNTLQINMRLSEFIQEESERTGWRKVTITAENEAGLLSDKNASFVVNPGPNGKLVTQVGGKTVDVTSKASNKPVTVVLTEYKKTIVTKRGDIPGSYDITLQSMQFRIKTVKKNGETKETNWTKLGATQLQITEEGTSTVWVKLVDSEGNEKTISMVVKIDYNQKRF